MLNFTKTAYTNLCKHTLKQNQLVFETTIFTFKNYFFKLTNIFIIFLKICKLLKTNFSIIITPNGINYIKHLLTYNKTKIENYTLEKPNKLTLKRFNSVFINLNCIDHLLHGCKFKAIKTKFNTLNPKNNKIYNLRSLASEYRLHNNNKTISMLSFINNFSPYAQNFIFGQNDNLSKITDKLLNLNNTLSKKPIASYFLCGPSGTGKTEISKLLSTYIYKKPTKLIHIDMSEYMEENSTSKLIGSSPGHIGSDKTGFLIRQILHNPDSVVLFDEIEKAHPKVYSLFLQILDEGVITSSNTKKGYFNKAIIIFTSNLGSDILKTLKTGSTKSITYEVKTIKKIKNHFRPELINRLDDIIIFNPLNVYSSNLVLNKFLAAGYNKNIKMYNSIKSTVLIICYYPLKGSRFLINNINSIILPINYEETGLLWCHKFFNCLLK